MVSVYRIVPAVGSYRALQADDVAALMKFRFDGTPLRDGWHPPDVYVHGPRLQEGHFWGCLFSAAVLAVKHEVAEKIVTFLDQSCETLPLVAEEEGPFILVNVISVVNCLNKKKSRHKRGLPHWIDEYAFHANRFEYSVFKLPETGMSEILCVEGLVAAEDEFKGTVEKYGLTGLKFEQLWRGD
jgi:hypothetical protein